MPVRRTQRADQDLVLIYLEGARRFGTRQAELYAAHIEACFERLSDHPFMAPERHLLTTSVRIQPVGSHLVAYDVDSGGVIVLRVLHARQDWERALQPDG